MSNSSNTELASYAHGFKVLSKLEIRKALGKFDDQTMNSAFTEEFFETFDNIRPPQKSTDWLAQYNEKGQSYMEFLQLSRTLHTPSSADRDTIYLTVFGEVDNAILDFDSLINYTQTFFQTPVRVIHPFVNVRWDGEKNQWTCTMSLSDGRTRHFYLRTRFHEKTRHSQICVTTILNLLRKVVPMDARCLLALTMHDLYGNEDDLFIAGLAMGNCRVATFSLYRYDPHLTFDDSDWFACTFTGPTESKSEAFQRRRLLLVRACRLFTHEICHLFGINHCIFYSCLMNGSGNLDEDFRQPLFECPIDLRKLQTLIRFNIRERYTQLLDFFKTHDFVDEMKLVEMKLNTFKHDMKVYSTNCSQPAGTAKRKRTPKVRMNKDESVSPAITLRNQETLQSASKHRK